MTKALSTKSGSLMSVAEVAAAIRSGQRLLLAGDEASLEKLPQGDWIGGTIPYFVGAEGGVVSRDRIYVDELPDEVTNVRIRTYSTDHLEEISKDRFERGFSTIILPAMSSAHLRFAAEAPMLPGIFGQPLVGWVSGVHLDDLGTKGARVFAGEGTQCFTDDAVVLHAELAEGVLAQANIVNLFEQGDGATLTFAHTGFSQDTVLVDGEPRNFAAYLREIEYDTRLPLVADYFGTMVNVSIQNVPEDSAPVDLYAPVFAGNEYRFAAPVDDYVSEFRSRLPEGSTKPAFACNCILNFLYSELEGKRTGDVTGPMTFGEVAYQLLNQTLVYLTLHR